MSETPASQSSTEAFGRTWSGQVKYWHAVFAVTWVLAAAGMMLDVPSEYGRTPEALALAIIALAYVFLGRPALDTMNRSLGLWYQVIAWTATLSLVAINPGSTAWVLLFVLYPQMWAVLGRRLATIGSVMTVLAIAGIQLAWAGGRGGSALPIVFTSIVSLGLSLGLGLFITRMTDEAQARARVIDELRATQDALALAERERGVLAERTRLSRDIHDTLAQGFTSVVALARAAETALAKGDTTTASERLALIERTAAENLAEARLMVSELGSSHLESGTLVEAIHRLAATTQAESRLPVTVDVGGTPRPLPPNVDIVMLRAAQEALANARRHSGAATVRVDLTYRDDEVALTVTDDGEGFDPEAPAQGYGLAGLRARAAEVGGEATIETRPGAGTSVRLIVPA